MKRIRIHVLLASVVALGAFVVAGQSVLAQTTTDKKPGLMARMKQKLSGKKTDAGASATAHAGEIIGNKNTKVYHLPGSKGALPAEKNRVYFKTEAEAKAAGYRLAGSKAAPVNKGPARDPKTGKFIKKT